MSQTPFSTSTLGRGAGGEERPFPLHTRGSRQCATVDDPVVSAQERGLVHSQRHDGQPV